VTLLLPGEANHYGDYLITRDRLTIRIFGYLVHPLLYCVGIGSDEPLIALGAFEVFNAFNLTVFIY
jgi:hypothetical protein